MARERYRRLPKETTSRWQAPSISFNLEIGVSFSPNQSTHTLGAKYVSRRMEEKLHRERLQRQHESGYFFQGLCEQQQYQQTPPPQHQSPQPQRHPSKVLSPPITLPLNSNVVVEREFDQQRTYSQQHRRRQGSDAKRRSERRAPGSFNSSNSESDPIHYIPHIAALPHTHSIPLERAESHQLLLTAVETARASPSQFRLGVDELPWSMPAFYLTTESGGQKVSAASRRDRATTRMEDPQRARELNTLQQALMTVDSLRDDWDMLGRENVNSRVEEPGTVGWAISSQDDQPVSPMMPNPSPYLTYQWEQRTFQRPAGCYP